MTSTFNIVIESDLHRGFSMKSFKQLWLSVAREVLVVTKDGEVPDKLHTGVGVTCWMGAGICKWSVTCAVPVGLSEHRIRSWLKGKFKQWPKFSGDTVCPIDSGAWPFAPKPAWTEYTSTTHTQKWSPFHPYGALRRELLEFLIQEMEKEDEYEWMVET